MSIYDLFYLDGQFDYYRKCDLSCVLIFIIGFYFKTFHVHNHTLIVFVLLPILWNLISVKSLCSLLDILTLFSRR